MLDPSVQLVGLAQQIVKGADPASPENFEQRASFLADGPLSDPLACTRGFPHREQSHSIWHQWSLQQSGLGVESMKRWAYRRDRTKRHPRLRSSNGTLGACHSRSYTMEYYYKTQRGGRQQKLLQLFVKTTTRL
jgi:hypothetical protein